MTIEVRGEKPILIGIKSQEKNKETIFKAIVNQAIKYIPYIIFGMLLLKYRIEI